MKCIDMERIFNTTLKKGICIGILFLMLESMSGCEKKSVLLNGELGKGICYHGKMYWWVGVENDILDAKKIGVVKEIEKKGIFPNKHLAVTSSMERFVDKNIYSTEAKLYIKQNGKNYVFQFLTEMELGEEKKETPFLEDEASYPPHLVQNDMRYWYNNEITVETIPKSFYWTGKVKEMYFYATQNNTGNIEVGTEFFISDFQNRYIIVRHKDGSLSVFENEVYCE